MRLRYNLFTMLFMVVVCCLFPSSVLSDAPVPKVVRAEVKPPKPQVHETVHFQPASRGSIVDLGYAEHQHTERPTVHLNVDVPATISNAIENASREFGVPTELLYAQAYTESRFNPNDTGSADDIGLFQIIPSTAMEINRMHFNIQGFTPSMLYDPTLNARFACAYLVDMHKYTDSWVASLTAYNLGLGGERAYVRSHGDSLSPYYERVAKSHETLYGASLSL